MEERFEEFDIAISNYSIPSNEKLKIINAFELYCTEQIDELTFPGFSENFKVCERKFTGNFSDGFSICGEFINQKQRSAFTSVIDFFQSASNVDLSEFDDVMFNITSTELGIDVFYYGGWGMGHCMRQGRFAIHGEKWQSIGKLIERIIEMENRRGQLTIVDKVSRDFTKKKK